MSGHYEIKRTDSWHDCGIEREKVSTCDVFGPDQQQEALNKLRYWWRVEGDATFELVFKTHEQTDRSKESPLWFGQVGFFNDQKIHFSQFRYAPGLDFLKKEYDELYYAYQLYADPLYTHAIMAHTNTGETLYFLRTYPHSRNDQATMVFSASLEAILEGLTTDIMIKVQQAFKEKKKGCWI